jgi:hypothetical protein
MVRCALLLVTIIASVPAYAKSEPDYGSQRTALAASSDYDAHALQGICYGLMKEYQTRAANPRASVMDINKPLAELVRIYPLGVQLNLTLADFLEYVARNADSADPKQTKDLLDLAAAKRKKAAAILASVEASGDGTSPDQAMAVINIMEELAVLDSHGLRKGEQSLVERNGRYFDAIVVETKNGTRSTIYFDVSSFYRSAEKSQ